MEDQNASGVSFKVLYKSYAQNVAVDNESKKQLYVY